MDNADYVKRIMSATPLELIIINYELFLKSVGEAVDSIDQEPVFSRDLGRAKGFLSELIVSLNMENPVARQLMPIYLYVNRMLIQADVTKDRETRIKSLNDCERIFEHLLPGWQGISEEDIKSVAAVMDNPKVYAGLTYGRGGEMQEYATDSEKRGIEV